MFDKIFLERLKTGLLLIGLVAFNVALYYVGFSCKPTWQFFFIMGAFCFFTPVLLALVYVLATKRSFRVDIFSRFPVSLFVGTYYTVWFLIGIGLQIYWYNGRQPFNETDFKLIKLSLGCDATPKNYRDHKKPDVYLCSRQHPEFDFYISKHLITNDQEESIQQHVFDGDYVRVHVLKSDLEEKLASSANTSRLFSCNCYHAIPVFSIENEGRVLLPLDIETINKARSDAYPLYVISLFPFIMLPLWLLYKLISNYRINKKRGFTG